MSALPRLLVIDDLHGRAPRGGNRDRQMFCARLGVRDITGDMASPPVESPVAEAVLISGQHQIEQRMVNDLEGVVQRVRSGWQQWPRWSLVMVDLHFQTGPIDPASEPGLEGLPLVVLSAMERERIERRFARRGVFAFVEKDRLDRQGLRDLLWEHGLIQDDRIVARSLPVLTALRDARRQSRIGNTNILLLGETGTGKELVADYIHRCSQREGLFRKVFVRSNDDMFAADLFGYVKGAFTGAIRDRAGEAEQADGGTLFLDEFGDIPAGSRDKLLRLLDTSTRESQRIGDGRIRKLDLQVVMATNRFEILKGGFRGDLLHRANAAHPIVLPPLRQRREDIPLLAEFFVRRHELRLGAERREIAPEALDLLAAFSWPGNVRELENELLKAVSSYRGIRYLVPEHIEASRREQLFLETVVCGQADDDAAIPPAATPGDLPIPAPGGAVPVAAPGGTSLREVLSALEAAEFAAVDSEGWAGGLEEVQGAYARMVARYLNAALAASAIASGVPRPTTAMRMLLDRKKLRTSDAAGAIKRLLSISREAIADLLADDTLHLGRTLEWAENLRGRKGHKAR